MSHYPLHPAAEIFPEMDASALAALTADIAAHGQREPILILDGQVIDGRCRLQACEQLGIEPLVRDVSAEVGDPWALVVSLNLHRRHLSESQRATVAARKANMARGGDRPSRTDATFDSARLQNRTEASQAQAAGLLQVSPCSVASAPKVLPHGIPELVAAVDPTSAPSVEPCLPAAEFEAPLYVPTTPLTDSTLGDWIATALPGERVQYHQGLLLLDRSATTSPYPPKERQRIHAVAKRAWQACELGLVHLVSQRVEPFVFRYLAVRTRMTPKAADVRLQLRTPAH